LIAKSTCTICTSSKHEKPVKDAQAKDKEAFMTQNFLFLIGFVFSITYGTAKADESYRAELPDGRVFTLETTGTTSEESLRIIQVEPPLKQAFIHYTMIQTDSHALSQSGILQMPLDPLTGNSFPLGVLQTWKRNLSAIENTMEVCNDEQNCYTFTNREKNTQSFQIDAWIGVYTQPKYGESARVEIRRNSEGLLELVFNISCGTKVIPQIFQIHPTSPISGDLTSSELGSSQCYTGSNPRFTMIDGTIEIMTNPRVIVPGFSGIYRLVRE
jgi:hypothetical protein